MNYTYDNATDNFSTGFAFGATAPTTTTADTYSFAGATYTATDDLTVTLNGNALNFANTGAVTLARGGTGTNNSFTLGGTAPTINLTDAVLVTDALDLILSANTLLLVPKLRFGNVCFRGTPFPSLHSCLRN